MSGAVNGSEAVPVSALEALISATETSYSYDRYRSWSAVCKAMLLMLGLSHQQAVAVLMSKWTRWAADASGKVYGQSTSVDLAKFVVRQGPVELDKLTAEHWGGLQ